MHLPNRDMLAEIDRTLPPFAARTVSLMVRLSRARSGGDATNARAIARSAGPYDMTRLLDAWESDLPRLIEDIADGRAFRERGSYEERLLDQRIYLRHIAEGLLRERDPDTRVVDGWATEEERLWQQLEAEVARDGYTFADGKLNAATRAPQVEPRYRSDLHAFLVTLQFPDIIWTRLEAGEARLRTHEYSQAAAEVRIALDRCAEEVVRRAIQARPETLPQLKGGEIARWWNCAQYLRGRGFFGREQQLDPTEKKMPGELRLMQGLHDFISLKGAHGDPATEEDGVLAVYATQMAIWSLLRKFERWALTGFPDLVA